MSNSGSYTSARTKRKLNHSILNSKCAAVLAKRWQSAAHLSTDSVAGRVGLEGMSWEHHPYPQTGAFTADPSLHHHAPCSATYRREHQKATSGDLSDHNLLFGFEAGERS